MLVLTREINQSILIGGNITVTFLSQRGSKIRLGVEAPDDVTVVRDNAKNKEPREETTR